MLCFVSLNNALADGMIAPENETSVPEAVGKTPSQDDSEAALLAEIQRIRKEHKEESRAGDPKERQISYRKDTDTYRAQIESPEWQQAAADRRNFAVFSRNYINRIHCSGIIEDVLYPTTKGAELELKNNGHDLFLRMGVDVPDEFSHFPLDLNIICDGHVYQINGVVDDQYPATNLELLPTKGLSTEKMTRYGTAIRAAAALPHEEQIARILRRVWNDDPMPYWRKEPETTLTGKETEGIVLRQRLFTGISELVAWDIVVQNGKADIPDLLAAVQDFVTGPIVALGRVVLRGTQRVVVLTKDMGGRP